MGKRLIAHGVVALATACLFAMPAAADAPGSQESDDLTERFAWYDASEGSGAQGVLQEELERLAQTQTAEEVATLSRVGGYLGGVDEDFNLVAVLPYPDDIVPYGADVSADGTTRQEQSVEAAAEGWTSSRDARTTAQGAGLAASWGGCLGDTPPYAAEIKQVGPTGKTTYTCWDGRGTNNQDVTRTNQWCAGGFETTYWFGTVTDGISPAACHEFLDPLSTDTVTKAVR